MSIHATSTEVYSGKNLLRPNNNSTAQGVSFVWNSDGTVTLDGTVTQAADMWIGNGNDSTDAFSISSGEKITCSYQIVSGTASSTDFWKLRTILYYNGSNHWGDLTGNTTFTASSTTGVRGTEILLLVGATFDNCTFKIQIEKSASATAFEPYVGGVPSPLISGVAHVSTSKNLLNMQSGNNGEYFGTMSQGGYSGKNLYLPIGKDTPNSGLTLTYNQETGECSITGTSTRTWSDLTDAQSCDLPAGTYTFSVSNPALADASFILRLSLEGGTSQDINLGWGTGGQPSKSITVSSKITSLRFWIGVTQNVTINWTGELQLEQGSTATAFEPYVGGVPSPNPDYPQEIVVGKLKSKNLFAVGKTNGTIASVLYTYNSDGTFSLSGTASAGTGAKSAPIPIAESGLIPGQKYSFWCDHNVGWGSDSCVYYAQSCDSSGNWTGNLMTFTQSGRTATMPSTTAQYVMFVAAISNGSSYSSYNNVKAQLVAGEQADNVFEPYFTPIEITQIGSYQDKVYKNGGNWRIETRNSKMLLDGSQTWTVGTGTNAYWTALAGSNDYNPIQTTMSDQFVGIAYNDRGNTPPNIMYRDNQTLTIRNTSFASASAATSWFTSNPATVYYLLATPTDTAITDSATILWLNKYDTDSLPHHKYVNTRRTTYVGASGLASAIDLYDGSYASALPTYADANDHHLTTANGGTYTVSLQNISAKIVSGTVTFSVFTNQRKIDFSWNGSATSTSVSVSLQADEYIKSIYAYIPQNADAGITLSQQLESGSLTDFEPYYNIVKIYAGDDLVFEDTSLTD